MWGGAGVLDNCGVCDSDPLNDNLTCQRDCNGIWGGGAVVDVCNICGGDGVPVPTVLAFLTVPHFAIFAAPVSKEQPVSSPVTARWSKG